MEKSQNRNGGLSRRNVLKLSPLLLLAGCNTTPGGRTQSFLQYVQKFNDWVQGKVFDPTKLAPEYADAQATPEEGFRVNGKDADDPDIDLDRWYLSVEGMVKKPGMYSLDQIKSLPKREMNTRHCCVEGWSMIPRWAGTPMKDFLQMVGADPKAGFLSVHSVDDYYTSYDMASVLQPQTMLCYEAYGKPLTIPHGAPVRVVMPTKLGYKSAKWITKITVTNQKTGGYWEDQGYDWFAGI
jgi:DMSO/TMAO reductase YedYZ molybdopterin-dependent catalytic subunit